MKNLFLTLYLCASLVSLRAAEFITATATFTNTTANGNSNIVNGATSRWTNSPLDSVNWIVTGSSNVSATNFAFFLGRNYPSLITTMTSSNVVRVRGSGLTLAFNGGFGFVSLSTNQQTNSILLSLPFDNQFATNRTNNADELIYGLNKYARTNAFDQSAQALTNFVSRTNAQTVANKVLTNSAIQGGSVSNATIIGGSISNASGNFLTNTVAHTLLVTNLYAPGTGIGSLKIGTNSVASSNYTLAIGESAIATNDYAQAIGNGAVAGGVDSLAVGRSALAQTNSAVAIGNGSTASKYAAVAIGPGAESQDRLSVAIGAGSSTTTSNQIRLGTSSEHVSIPGRIADVVLTNSVLRGTNVFIGDQSFTRYDITTVANGNNIAVIFGTNRYIRLAGTVTASPTLCGLVGGRDGLFYDVQNALGYSVVLSQNNVDPTPANRFSLYGATDVTIPSGGYFQLAYDSSLSRWIVRNAYPVTSYETNVLYDNIIAGTTYIASNASTATIDFAYGTPVYEVTNLNTALTLYITNLVYGRDRWVYFRTDGAANRNITISTNLCTNTTRVTWGFNSTTNGGTSFTVTNRARLNMALRPIGEVSAAYEHQQ